MTFGAGSRSPRPPTAPPKRVVPSAPSTTSLPRVDPNRVAQGKRVSEKVTFQAKVAESSHKILVRMAENLNAPLNLVVELALACLDDVARTNPERFGQILARRMVGDEGVEAEKDDHDRGAGASREGGLRGGDTPREPR